MYEYDEDDEKILEPYFYLLKTRKIMNKYSHVLKAFNHWTNLNETQLKQLEEVAQLLLHALALIDDIEDDCAIRNGIPTAHAVYGIPLTINAANFLYFQTMDKIMDMFPDKELESTTIYIDQMMTVHLGIDSLIYWTEVSKCPTEEEYEKMINEKIGSVLLLFVKLMQLCNDDKTDYSKLINLISVYLQIRQDYSVIKSVCDENQTFVFSTNKRFIYPIIHATKYNPKDMAIMDFIKEKPINGALKKLILDRLEETGSLVYTWKKLTELNEQIQDEIENLGGNVYLEQMITVSMESDDHSMHF